MQSRVSRQHLSRLLGLALVILALSYFIQLSPPVNVEAAPGVRPSLPANTNPEFFGMVGRDPWYEWNTNPRQPGSNLEFLENMAREMQQMGVRYIRIEFRADMVPGTRGGVVNYAKYDAFINEIAPRYNLKVLGLLGYGLVSWAAPGDDDLHYRNFMRTPDQPNGTNPLVRLWGDRARDVIAHYGDRVGAWELLNEVNGWDEISLHPLILGALMTYVYDRAKPTSWNTKILVGSQMAPQPPERVNSYDYLREFYLSVPVRNYYNAAKRYPWDGLAWHPYQPNVDDAVGSVQRVVKTMREWNDNTKIWVTEVGKPANLRVTEECKITSDEEHQAYYLQTFYTRLLQESAKDVAAVFWFKYEDFYDNNGKVLPHGVVRLEREGTRSYAPQGKVTYYKAAYYAMQRLARPGGLVTHPVPPPAEQFSTQNPNAPYYIAETGHTLQGAFLQYWLTNGGIKLFGFPITEPFEELNPADGKRYSVQYFERERLEYHPESNSVMLGLLGRDYLRLDCRTFTPLPPPADKQPAFRSFYKETGHYMSFAFKDYWEKNGGLAVFGYPISEEFGEVDPATKKPRVVQYFERARFEFYATEKPGNQVKLALLGTEILKRRGLLG